MYIDPSENILTIRVIPGARRTEYIGMMDDGSHRIRIHAPPEDGRANTELLDYLGELTDAEWSLLSGARSRIKRVRRCDV